ncbi:MAG: radical SAM protein [Endomicrobiales bacterium]|nr:radical SAM protein [Endomicrobiales bacterium]
MKPQANLFRITDSKYIPLICTFELTRRCNLRCRHCYIDVPPDVRSELSTGEIKNSLKQLSRMGTLMLVFTGGEIFLRKDLLELCRYAKKLNFDLKLFTNGTQISKNDAEELSKISISGVEISLYGRENVHDGITGRKGAFEKSIRSVEMLKKHGINVTIKCPLTNLNYSERGWIRKFAKKSGINFKFDPTIAPADSGNQEILKYRMNNRQLTNIYRELGEKPPEAPARRRLDDLSCSAGRNVISIISDGTVYPCLQLALPLGNIKHQKLDRIWSQKNKVLAGYRSISNKDIAVCNSCDMAYLCQRCPGIAKLEDGSLFGPSKIACQIAKIHKKMN